MIIKTTCATLLFVCLGFFTQAQLINTKWKGSLDIDGGLPVQFNFGADTLIVVGTNDFSTLETLHYTQTDSVVTFQHLYGESRCDSSTIGKYKFEMSQDTAHLRLIEDKCEERSAAINNLQLKKLN